MASWHEHWISPEEYLEIDRTSIDAKYKYVDGHMYQSRSQNSGTLYKSRCFVLI